MLDDFDEYLAKNIVKGVSQSLLLHAGKNSKFVMNKGLVSNKLPFNRMFPDTPEKVLACTFKEI